MHITITTLAISNDAKHIDNYWIYTHMLRQNPSELAMLPIENLDDPNNIISIWSNVQAADIVVCLISAKFLVALDSLTDLASGNNLIRDALQAKRNDPQFRVIPIVLSKCSWNDRGTVFAGLTAALENKPVNQMQAADAWHQITLGIKRIIKKLCEQDQQVYQPQPQIATVQPKATACITPSSFCRKCGDPLPANAAYCHCGATISSVSQPALHFANTYQAQPTISVTPAQPVPTQPASTPQIIAKSVFLVYSTQDKSLAETCMKILSTCGIHVLDREDIAPGANWRDALKKHLNCASSILFLLSADMIGEWVSKDRHSVIATIRDCLSQTIIARSYGIIIRYCGYEYAFSNAQPQFLLALDNKPISASSRKEESWYVIGQYLYDQLP